MDQYIVSARKYRPITFESVVGQRSLTEMLRNAIRSNHLAHAYLFCGPRGVGKTTCARIFAKTINCQNLTPESDACNECDSCKSFNAQQSFNYHELDAASNNSVDNIRDLIKEVLIPPQDGKYSVFVIDEVHMLSTAAFNALLKTLEEPPAHVIFIMATTEKHKVLPTILSRCQVFDFSRITVSDIIEHLKYVARTEGYTVEDSALAVVAKKADGGMRDALSVFDQLATYCTDAEGLTNITYEKTIQVLNVLDTDYYFRLVNIILSGDISAALLLLNEILEKGFDSANFLSGFASHLRDILVSKDPQTASLLETSESIRAQYVQQAKSCSAMWLFKVLDAVSTAEFNHRTARDKRLTVELLLVRLCSFVQAQAVTQSAEQPQPLPNIPAQPRPNVAPQPKPNVAPQPKPNVAPQPKPNVAPQAKPNVASPLPGIPTIPTMPPMQSSAAQASVMQSASVQPSSQPANINTDNQRPFTEEQMADAWKLMCRQLFANDKINLALLSNISIKKKSELVYEVQLPNKILQEEISAQHSRMLRFLKEQLHNGQIQLEVGVEEQQQTTVAYTAEEKMNVLLQLNPELQNMRTELGLIIE